MNPIAIISTGGTFNKVYRPLDGTLTIDSEATSLHALSEAWRTPLEILPMIHKDSLEMTDQDRAALCTKIRTLPQDRIIVIHGTDTMEVTAAYLARHKLPKRIVLTGAMVPYSIDPVEATANFASAYGSLQADGPDGVTIAMHGLIEAHDKLTKVHQEGRFMRRL
jgi:L-asparaginase